MFPAQPEAETTLGGHAAAAAVLHRREEHGGGGGGELGGGLEEPVLVRLGRLLLRVRVLAPRHGLPRRELFYEAEIGHGELAIR